MESDPKAITMGQASGFASLAKEPAPLPSWVQADSSYIIFKDTTQMKTTFNDTIMKKFPTTTMKDNALSAGVINMKTLTEELTKNAALYTGSRM